MSRTSCQRNIRACIGLWSNRLIKTLTWVGESRKNPAQNRRGVTCATPLRLKLDISYHGAFLCAGQAKYFPSSTSDQILFALSVMDLPVRLQIIPPTSNPTPRVAAPNTVVPKAIPPPPAAIASPPRAANVALVAAIPLREAVAVPVEAVPNAMTAAVVAPAAAKPPAVPRAAPPKPPKSTPAPMEICSSSSRLY